MKTRRSVLAGIVSCVAIGRLSSRMVPQAVAGARIDEDSLPKSVPSSSAAGKLYQGLPNSYFAYPHANGFLPGSGNPVIAQRGGTRVTYHEWKFRTGETRSFFQTDIGNMYWDIAESTGDLYFIDGKQRIASISSTAGPDSLREVSVHLDSSQRLEPLVSVSRDGRKLLYALERANGRTAVAEEAQVFELDLNTGSSSRIVDMPFDADHQHYCPYDESWIGFSHEGNISKSLVSA